VLAICYANAFRFAQIDSIKMLIDCAERGIWGLPIEYDVFFSRSPARRDFGTGEEDRMFSHVFSGGIQSTRRIKIQLRTA
jgi:hypothetical protein